MDGASRGGEATVIVRRETDSFALQPAQLTAAKAAGLLYLLQMATGVFGFYAHGRLTVAQDAAQTAKNMVKSETLFRIGTVSDLLTAVLVVILAWALYVILKPVGPNLALLALLLRLVENAIAAAALFTDFLALRVLTGAAYSNSLDAGQLQVLARILINGHGFALRIAFVFLGLGTAIYSCLWLRSRFIPKPIAIWGIFSALLLSILTLAIMVYPRLGALGLTYMLPLGIYEVGLGLWLLIRGIREPQQDAQGTPR